ncbi:cyclic peptide export ABC transporter [Hymenobacter sp. BT635]|uniref:Cyclic peptide export ABC transporter n=1 Tax=Hymenobacter nitidus TaxID=2880929 RepID=A0ABS8A9H3_9BACT|nr:cyclic peptide export ABC transporter [Hymenobacter nitidus]MCB2376582.1 cyclic peptide export ABC transporter [Hymenobacter nitidus]
MSQLKFSTLIRFIFLSFLSGGTSFLFLTFVNRVIGQLMTQGYGAINQTYTLLFLLIVVLFVWTRRVLALAIIRFSQSLFWSLRKDIIFLVLKSNFQQLSSRKDLVHTALVRDINMLTNASLNIIQFATAIIIVAACLVYMATVSLPLFLVSLSVIVLATLLYQFNARRNNEAFKQARALEDRFMFYFNAILGGFKEIYMDTKKGRRIYDKKIARIADESVVNQETAFVGLLNNQITGQTMFYLLIGAILLYCGAAWNIAPTDTVSFLFILLYVLSSVETIMVLLPNLLQAKISSDRIAKLQADLLSEKPLGELVDLQQALGDFETISARDLTFQYGSAAQGSFEIGPVNFTISRGEVVFINGGNGSGKTTFVSALLGLLLPASGGVYYNGYLIDEQHSQSYSALFGVVFSDFYLFDEFYGIDQLDEDKLAYYLRLFEIDAKVTVENGRFSTTHLSTGQRKRLALITALLEAKPLLVLDEWAADQDPYFRKKFYTQIVPELKEAGFTIIAITHDDKYYTCADTLYKMEYGKLVREEEEVLSTL